MTPRFHPSRSGAAAPAVRTIRSATTVMAALTLSLLVAACGTSAQGGASAAAPPTAPPAATVAPSAAATPPASGDQTVPPPSLLPETPEPSVDAHGVPALEAHLPTRLGTIDLETRSLTGDDFYALGTTQTRAQLDGMLANLDKTVADLTVADAYDPSGVAVLEVGAFRVAGAKPARLLSEWVAVTQASKPGKISVTNTTVGGRPVTMLVDSTIDVGPTTYAFAVGDTIFLVRAADPKLSTEAIGKLPTS